MSDEHYRPILSEIDERGPTPSDYQQCEPSEESLKEFAHKFVAICKLEVDGKISPEDAKRQISNLWHSFQRDKSQ